MHNSAVPTVSFGVLKPNLTLILNQSLLCSSLVKAKVINWCQQSMMILNDTESVSVATSMIQCSIVQINIVYYTYITKTWLEYDGWACSVTSRTDYHIAIFFCAVVHSNHLQRWPKFYPKPTKDIFQISSRHQCGRLKVFAPVFDLVD